MLPMWGAGGRAPARTAVTFVSALSLENGLARTRGGERELVPVRGRRGVRKTDMIRNGALPRIEVNPATYEVRADGELLTCAPVDELPLARRYALF